MSNLKDSYHLNLHLDVEYDIITDMQPVSMHLTSVDTLESWDPNYPPPIRNQAVFSKKILKNVKYFNISNNQLDQIPDVVQLLGQSIEELDLSHNRISVLDARIFAKFPNLMLLDLRFCEITSIEFESFQHLSFPDHNKHLMDLNLKNNPIGKLDCSLFLLLMRMKTAKISLQNIVSLETSCMGKSLEIDLDDKDLIIFRFNGSEFQYPREQFQMILNLNVAGNQLKNGPQLIESLGSSIVDLNMSGNDIGELSARTFERFQNLHFLCLSHCNLSNFGFTTFYHQKNLRQLDISYNHLKKINFTLFWRNFKELNRLNMEGNDLIEINTVTNSTFPKLHFLAISKNHFSCDYLLTFLQQWNHIILIGNPSAQQIHIDGIDCYHKNHDEHEEHAVPQNSSSRIITNTQKNLIDSVHLARSRGHSEHQDQQSKVISSNGILYELRALMYSVLSICTIICAYLLVKSKIIQRIRRNMTVNPIENRVLCQRNHQDTNSIQGIFIS